MCLRIPSPKTKNPPAPQVATEDITVYKGITKDGYGIFNSLWINNRKENGHQVLIILRLLHL